MKSIGAIEAEGQFSTLLDWAEQGEEIVVTRRGDPIAKLVPVRKSHNVDRALAAAKRIQRTAERIARNNITLDEIKAWTTEGRH